jgi:hypothetical protein
MNRATCNEAALIYRVFTHEAAHNDASWLNASVRLLHKYRQCWLTNKLLLIPSSFLPSIFPGLVTFLIASSFFNSSNRTYTMASRPMFKQQDSFGPTVDAYELQPHGGQSTPSIRNGINGDAPIAEEDERRLKGATVNDQNDMHRLGKTQELRVRSRAYTDFSEHS